MDCHRVEISLKQYVDPNNRNNAKGSVKGPEVGALFIFSCYTGLAYIDVCELTPKNLSLGIDGVYWINTCRHKTDIPVRVPLLPQAMTIVEKYKNNPCVLESGRLLPVMLINYIWKSERRLLMDNYLQDKCTICNIWYKKQ